MIPLPEIMVAPNGAHRTKSDHPALPVTLADIVETACACHEAGADGLHAHVRDENGKHVLDAGLYRELIAEMARQAPGMVVQITTEAAGIYTPGQQRRLVRDVMPSMVSVSLAEMLDDGEFAAAAQFYHWAVEAGIAVQHILYDARELRQLQRYASEGVIPDAPLQMLFVLGRYAAGQQSHPAMLKPFLDALGASGPEADWAVCAFGPGETDSLIAAAGAGGKLRVGFENSLWHPDGAIAADNAERVTCLVSRLQAPVSPGKRTPGDQGDLFFKG